MAIYYVDSNASGANNGSSWTDAYADVVTALAGSVSTNDDIYAAHNHAASYGSSQTMTFPNGVTVTSVNSGTDAYQAGAQETCSTSSADITITSTGDNNSRIFFRGIRFVAGDDLIFQGTGAMYRFFEGGIGANQGSGSRIHLANDGVTVVAESGTLDFGNAANYIDVTNGSKLYLRDMSAQGGSTAVTFLFEADSAGNGGRSIHAEDCDFSNVIAASGYLFSGTAGVADNLHAEIKRCYMPSGWGIFSAATSSNYNYRIYISETGNADSYYRFYYADQNLGTAQDDTTTYLNATYDGTNGISAQLDSGSDATPQAPFKYKLWSKAAVDLTTAQTVTVECTSDASLTDNDLWIEVVRNDNTNEALTVTNSTQNSDPLAAGTGLTTAGTGTWTNGDTEDYIITYNIGALANVDNGTVTVYACVGAASIAANFDLPTIAAT